MLVTALIAEADSAAMALITADEQRAVGEPTTQDTATEEPITEELPDAAPPPPPPPARPNPEESGPLTDVERKMLENLHELIQRRLQKG